LSPTVKKISASLARVRKELPPPGKMIQSKKSQWRKHAKEELHQELKLTLRRDSR
jgi:hypothetical protein